MDIKKSKRMIATVAIIYWVFVIGIYAIANEQFRYATVAGAAPASGYTIGEVVDGIEIRQSVLAPAEFLKGVEIKAGTYDRINSGTLTVAVLDSAENVLAQESIDVSAVENNAYTTILLDQTVEVTSGEILTLQLTTQGCFEGNAITLYAGNLLDEPEKNSGYLINETVANSSLCVRLTGYRQLTFYKTYWVIVTSLFAVLSIYVFHCWKEALRGKSNPLVSVLTVHSRYSFLIKQLVSRDFKTKYKRSALGMAWSFMNPLLTMSVQYVVFSTLFRSDIPNYPVYLLTGIVFYSFFNEAVTMGMTAITGNASLIKKVYMPKYIYPFSRILSSLINFVFALMPLLIVMLITRTPFKPAIILLLFDVLCMLAFITGMTLLLTTAMTFFQDTQFLWSVVSMMWQYLTPIFYPESIIPASYMPLYRLNPMYQFISFARTCVTGGISPEPMAYLGCLLSGCIFLLLGIVVFKKHQNKFVLYL